MSSNRQVLRIGSVGVSFEDRSADDLPGAFADFASDGACHCRLSVVDEPGLPSESWSTRCDAGIWRLLSQPGRLRYEGFAAARPDRPVLQADLAPDWSSGTVRMDPLLAPRQTRLAPFASPFGELLLEALLDRLGGLYVHAASVSWDDGADLFLGRSGAGKTTLSNLAQRQGAYVLSDDRTVLRLEDGRLFAYGTPFHGTGRRWAARKAPVRGLYFLEHGARTRTTALPAGEAAARLAAVTFCPFWDRAGVERALAAAELAVRSSPAFRLAFRPETSALEALHEAARSHRGPDGRVGAAAPVARGGGARGAPAPGGARRLDESVDPGRGPDGDRSR